MDEYISRKIATNVIGNIDTSRSCDDKDDIVEQAIGFIDRLPAADISPELEKFAEVIYYRLIDQWKLLKSAMLSRSPSNPDGECEWLHNEILSCLEEFKSKGDTNV